MHAWESIQKAVDRIEDNIGSPMKPKELAEVAALSPFYFQRLFAQLVGRPVGEYVRLRRLACACNALSDKNLRIVDVALEYGFASHQSFTRAFKDAYGITPEEYRKNPVHLLQVTKPDLLLKYVEVDEGVPLITDSIVIEITRRHLDQPEHYLGFSRQVSTQAAGLVQTTGIDTPGQLWEKFHARKADISGLIPGGVELGSSSFIGSSEGNFTYFAGAAAWEAAATDSLASWELPADDYIVRTVETETFAELTGPAVDKPLQYLFGIWLPGKGLTTQPFSAEKYHRGSEATAAEV